uniref:Zinc finger, CCHC-type n=1 Tax=Tanacetum cinerariifolium TaxID=118510 RepID=A0A699IRF4_TANCI|nr:hypothetical protein [Tanacetum cinerariifolium]GEZ81165.1 hypothetical protein [Tanacetum cinerariifolium]
MAAAAKNINNMTIRLILLAEKLTGLNFTNWYRNLRIVLRYEKNMKFVEQPTGPAPVLKTEDPDTIEKYYETVNIEQDVSRLMLSKQAKQELFETIKAFHACKQEEGQTMHSIGKTIAELYAMLKLYEKSILRMAETLAVLAIREGKIHKDKKKSKGAKGKDKGKNKLAYALKPKIPPPRKRDNLAKDFVYHHCKEVGYWRINCPSYQAELKKRKNDSVASASDDFKCYGYVYLMKHKHEVFETFKLTPPYTPLHNGVSDMRIQTLHDIVRSMINITPLPKSFWRYALESAARILNMVPTKKVERTPYEIWHEKAPKLSYLRVWGCEALVKQDTTEKHDPRSINLMVQEVSTSHGLLESSRSNEGLELIQEEDTQPSENTSKVHNEVAPIKEYELGGLNEPPIYKATLSYPKFDKCLEAMNTKMQSMKDNQLWVLVNLPPNGRTVRTK